MNTDAEVALRLYRKDVERLARERDVVAQQIERLRAKDRELAEDIRIYNDRINELMQKVSKP